VEPLFEIFVVWTAEHGIEPENFTDAMQAEGYALDLLNFAAYRDIKTYVSRIAMTPSDLLGALVRNVR